MAIRDDFFTALQNGAKWDVGVSIKRSNPVPLDSNSVFASQNDAETYAAGVLSYPGQIIAVVNEDNSVKLFTIQGDKSLVEIGSSSSPMQFVADENAMLALTELEIGQQVFREDTKTIWIFKGGLESILSNWVESAAQNDTVWQGTENKINFYSLTFASYTALETKDVNTLYFITDRKCIMKGAIEVSSDIIISSNIPAVGAMTEGKLYINNQTFEACFKSGEEIKKLSPGYLTDGANWATADSNKLATIGLIKKGITEAINSISLETTFDNTSGKITVGDNEATLTGVSHNPTYDSTAMKLTIPVYGGDPIVVNIPKDKFVTAGVYNAETGNIELTIEGQSEKVEIPAEAFVDVYTADNTGKDVTITVSDDNKISASVKIDPKVGNALVTSSAGLSVDVSGKLDKLVDATGSKIVVSTSDGSINESEYSVKATGDLGSSTTEVPVASVIAAAITSAINGIQSTLTTGLSGKLNKLSGTSEDSGKIAIVSSDGTQVEIGTVTINELATKTEIAEKLNKVNGTLNNLVAIDADGQVKDSGKSVGGATLKSVPDENTVATEAAVKKSVDDSALTWGTM